MEYDEREKAERRVEEILKSKGIKMKVSGCGCCGSPTVTFQADGEKVLDQEDFITLDTDYDYDSDEAKV